MGKREDRKGILDNKENETKVPARSNAIQQSDNRCGGDNGEDKMEGGSETRRGDHLDIGLGGRHGSNGEKKEEIIEHNTGI